MASERGQTTRQPFDDTFLPCAQPIEIDLNLAERQAGQFTHLAGLGQHSCRVEQRLGWDAANIETYAPQRRPTIDQDHLLTEVGGAERGAIAAWPGAQHEHLGVQI